MMDLENKALLFAAAAHCGINQRRKYSGEPYIAHPIAVAGIVRTVPHTIEMLAAAYLHDVVEDTPVTIEGITREFGPVVGDLVYWLTDKATPADGNRAKRNVINVEHIALAPAEAQTIKAADLIHNTKSIAALDADFWRVYRHEKLAILDVLTKADPHLMRIALLQCVPD